MSLTRDEKYKNTITAMNNKASEKTYLLTAQHGLSEKNFFLCVCDNSKFSYFCPQINMFYPKIYFQSYLHLSHII